jgi:hypothetical protein
MGKKSRAEYFRIIYARYRTAKPAEKSAILYEFCKVCGYNRKYAITKLNGPAPEKRLMKPKRRLHRRARYSPTVISVLASIWAATGFLCSVRLKAAIPLWLPWIRRRFRLSDEIEKELVTISARQMDRRLQVHKRKIKRSVYGKTKPGTLLKHHIPIKTDHWDVELPGFTEIDLVSHSGNSAAGNFSYSLNQTDIVTTWVETRAVMGKSQAIVVDALEDMRQNLPFALEGIDSDNGSEFINDHLYRYCQRNKIQFTRGRPYKKDDNAHIEQKNWTHVRKLFGWYRYDTNELVDLMNSLYRNELRWFMNLFTPSMKLLKKIRIGSRQKRLYDQPKTALDRLVLTGKGDPQKIAQLLKLRDSLNPFELTEKIERKLACIHEIATAQRPVELDKNRSITQLPNSNRPFLKKPWHSRAAINSQNRSKHQAD